MHLFMAVMTEIAIQMKGSLSFILGLGGLFSIVRTGLLSTIGLRDLPDDVKQARPSLDVDVQNARTEQRCILAISCTLFLFAIFLYLLPLQDINADALSQGTEVLTCSEALSVLGIVFVAVAILVLDVFRTIRLNRLDRHIALGSR
jgi:hypothetical protein